MALAQVLAQQGHPIALSARDTAALNQVHQQLLPSASAPHLIVPLDVSQYATVAQAQQQIMQQWSQIRRIIYLAGDYEPMRLDALDIPTVQRILAINLLGAYHMLAAALPELQPGSQIALCASVAGYYGLPNSQPYAASKAGLINLAETLRIEQGQRLDIKLINPGFVTTRLTAKNDFPMPGCLNTVQAAQALARGLQTRRFEIHFPKRLTYVMKLLRVLPAGLAYRLSRHWS